MQCDHHVAAYKAENITAHADPCCWPVCLKNQNYYISLTLFGLGRQNLSVCLDLINSSLDPSIQTSMKADHLGRQGCLDYACLLTLLSKPHDDCL